MGRYLLIPISIDLKIILRSIYFAFILNLGADLNDHEFKTVCVEHKE